MHTDKYGRTWRFKPGHDADSMVQVPWDVMAQFMAADRILTQGVGAEIWMNTEFAKARPDCYILKLGEHIEHRLVVDARRAVVARLVAQWSGTCGGVPRQ